MFIKKSLLILTISSFLAFSSAFAKSSSDIYQDPQNSYSITYPDNWEKQEQNSTISFVMFRSPPETKEDSFSENVNVVVEKAPGFNLDKYYKENLKLMDKPDALQNFKILKSGSKNINNTPSKYIIYKHIYNKMPLKVKAYFFCDGKNGYVITCTAMDKTFANYENKFDQIVNSFKLK